MSDLPLLNQLLVLTNLADQKTLLQAQHTQIDESLIEALKDRADQQLRADAHASLDTAALLYHAAALTGNPLHRALALFAEANAWSIGGLGDYQRALDLCDEAAAIYAHASQPVDQADAQVTKIYALAMLGRYGEAVAAGEWAANVLAHAQEWLRLATVTMNLAIVYGRMGKDAAALTQFDRAGVLYREAGEAGAWSLPGVEMNRAIVLRNLGRFEEAIAANTTAIAQLQALEQHGEVGHAQQTLAFTYYVLGRYNDALQLLTVAERTFTRYNRQSDQLLTALYRNHCLLALGRLGAVIAQSDGLAALAARLGQRVEEGHALLHKATALAGLGESSQALDLLIAVRALFAGAGNRVWAAEAELTAAALLCQLGRLDQALDKAETCATLFADHQLPVHAARAYLTTAEVRLRQGALEAATQLLEAVLTVATTQQLPTLGYHAHYLLGQAAEQADDPATALGHYDQSLVHVEQLRSRLMIEDRADFLVDKETIYAAAIRLALTQGQVATAHTYVERARARALQDLLTLRIDLRVRARTHADEALVAELNQLRQERDHHYRRLRYAQEFATVVTPSPSPAAETTTPAAIEASDSIHTLEERISARWHTLLIRNADYARDDVQGEISQVSKAREKAHILQTLQAQLPATTCLLSYYVSDKAITLFRVTADTIEAHPLSTSRAQLQRLVDLLQLNLNMAAVGDIQGQPALLRHAQKILHQLYLQLLAPVWDQLGAADTLVIAPHGPLHYVPFHALVTRLNLTEPPNSCYLLDTHTVSYVPGATFLATQAHPAAGGNNFVAFGHSYGGQLPETVNEAQTIAGLTGGQAFTEGAATKENLLAVAPTAHILHLATHGEFRADNPLFSGLALEDGRLSTLDIFHLRLSATLVTLSACRTGRSVSGGGDEQLGIMRAFFAAGAASLVLSHWAAQDASTAMLMRHFYQALLSGQSKGRALCSAQRALRDTQGTANDSVPYAHPYFWASFFLIGDSRGLGG